MANTLAVTQAVSSDHLTLTVTDSTTYSSPLRSAVGVFLNVYKVSFTGEETKLTTTPDNSDPNSTTSWTFFLSSDGHYRYKIVAPPDYSGVTSYAQYDAVFDPSGLGVYRSKSAGNSGNALNDTDFWELISDPATLADNEGEATESANMDSAIVNRVVYVLTSDKRDLQALTASLEACSDSDRIKDVNKFDLLDIFTAGLIEADASSQFNKGERIARRAESL